MRNHLKILLFLAKAIMPLSWLFAWSAFSLAAIFKRPLPLFGVLAAYILGAGATFLTSGRGWRVITILALHSAAMLLACLGIVYTGDAGAYPFFGTTWLLELISRPRDLMQWFYLIMLFVWGILFWIAGIRYARRPPSYERISNNFDLGCAAFLALMLLKLVILKKGGIQVPDPLSIRLLFPFFLFGFVALGLARKQSNALKDYLPGFRGVAMLATFSGVILLLGSGAFALMLPYLTAAAEIGYDIAKKGAVPLGLVIAAILRFLFTPRSNRSPMAESDQTEPTLVPLPEAGPLNPYIAWSLRILIGLVIAAGVACGIYLLLRWLFSTTATREKKGINWRRLFEWLAAFLKQAGDFWRLLCFQMQAVKEAPFYYRKLVKWGYNSGLPHRLSETPNEYGRRLGERFPALEPQIGMIIESFNQQVYAGNRPAVPLQPAWRRLRSPAFWPVRIKVRLIGSYF